jgi:hypothetical protein
MRFTHINSILSAVHRTEQSAHAFGASLEVTPSGQPCLYRLQSARQLPTSTMLYGGQKEVPVSGERGDWRMVDRGQDVRFLDPAKVRGVGGRGSLPGGEGVGRAGGGR